MEEMKEGRVDDIWTVEQGNCRVFDFPAISNPRAASMVIVNIIEI